MTRENGLQAHGQQDKKQNIIQTVRYKKLMARTAELVVCHNLGNDQVWHRGLLTWTCPGDSRIDLLLPAITHMLKQKW